MNIIWRFLFLHVYLHIGCLCFGSRFRKSRITCEVSYLDVGFSFSCNYNASLFPTSERQTQTVGLINDDRSASPFSSSCFIPVFSSPGLSHAHWLLFDQVPVSRFKNLNINMHTVLQVIMFYKLIKHLAIFFLPCSVIHFYFLLLQPIDPYVRVIDARNSHAYLSRCCRFY